MFCSKCGKEIEDNTKLCPYCGHKIAGTNMGNIADSVRKATDTVANVAQSVRNTANEATNGQAEKYVEKAKETAQSFVDDAKQAKSREEVRDFYKKNNYRNLKICIVLVIIIGGLWGALSGSDKGAKLAKNVVSETFSDCKIQSVKEVAGNDEGQIYVVKFIHANGKGDESSAVVLVTDDNATLVDAYPKSAYDRMEVFIDMLKKELK